ncbi:dehydrogenase E1 component subunit alpha/beta [Flavobacteriales bacterium]|nr:dehydrogenase E1 component subunit alpha/beta [Flavobacteriales bacterium]
MEVAQKKVMKFDRKGLTNKELVTIYKALLKPRLIEEKMLILLRQGKISKWFSGYGQEAISVGAALAMDMDEYILPMHRNLGIFTTRGIPLNRLFAQFQGKMSGFTKGRDRSFHFGSNEHHIVGMISHLGPQMGVADGIALATKLKKENKATIVFTGDGGASEGDFHESINTAAVWDLPVIFTVENNQWGLSTPSEQQFRCKQFVDKAIGYGIEGVQVDGNNILQVYHKIVELAESLRKNPRPILLECMTFRMRGHEEASGTKYYPQGIQDTWSIKDPVKNYQDFLLEEGALTDSDIESFSTEIREEITSGLDIAYAEDKIQPNTDEELSDVFAPYQYKEVHPGNKTSVKRLVDAISDGLRQSMQKFDDLVIMGQDIGKYGGVFKITEGFVDEFGEERVRNTPLCEAAIVGTGLGLSIKGMKAVVEMQFSDFVTEGFNQIVNNLAKIHWRWGQNADVVIRMPTGAGVAAGPFHSQSTEAWFFNVPGLKIVYPSSPEDAKGLLAASIEDPNPVMFFEHKALYRSLKSEVPDDYYTLEIGKAKTVQSGTDVSIITYGMGVHWAAQVANELNIDADIVDLRTLAPLDTEAIYNSVKACGKAIVLHEDSLTGGIGAEISALITEHCFESLDAPVVRCGSLDTPVPFEADLETNFLPLARFKEQLLDLVAY